MSDGVNDRCPFRLDAVLTPLREQVTDPTPLFEQEANVTNLAAALSLHADPQSAISGHWSSPAGRLVEIAARIDRPGAWFALHIPISLPDLADIGWIGIVLRSSAARAMGIRPCLRSGLADGGFRDDFFSRYILAQPGESDHHDLLAPAWRPDMPQLSPWREIVLFLPPAESFHLMLHDIRIFTL